MTKMVSVAVKKFIYIFKRKLISKRIDTFFVKEINFENKNLNLYEIFAFIRKKRYEKIASYY
jgi:hypothetical protein